MQRSQHRSAEGAFGDVLDEDLEWKSSLSKTQKPLALPQTGGGDDKQTVYGSTRHKDLQTKNAPHSQRRNPATPVGTSGEKTPVISVEASSDSLWGFFFS